MTGQSGQPPAGAADWPTPAEVARRNVEHWWTANTRDNAAHATILARLEWQLAVHEESVRLLKLERAVTIDAMAAQAGSLRKLADRIGRSYSTLWDQMRCLRAAREG